MVRYLVIRIHIDSHQAGGSLTLFVSVGFVSQVDGGGGDGS